MPSWMGAHYVVLCLSLALMGLTLSVGFMVSTKEHSRLHKLHNLRFLSIFLLDATSRNLGLVEICSYREKKCKSSMRIRPR